VEGCRPAENIYSCNYCTHQAHYHYQGDLVVDPAALVLAAFAQHLLPFALHFALHFDKNQGR
jgi:hypothetical protein